MVLGSHYESSPRLCLSTEDYREQCELQDSYKNMINYSTNTIEEKLIPDWFFLNLPYCDEFKKYIEFVDGVCSNHQLHKLLVTCNYCQNIFKTSSSRKVRCSSCCRLIECKLKTYTFDKLKKLANVYNIKRRKQEYIIDDLVQKVEKNIYLYKYIFCNTYKNTSNYTMVYIQI